MHLAPSTIIQSILRIKPQRQQSISERKLVYQFNSVRGDIQYVSPSISYKTEILRRRYCQEGVIVGAERQRIGVEGEGLESIWHHKKGKECRDMCDSR